MCGANANSAEHRLKRSDVVRAYGSGPYSGPMQPVHVRSGTKTAIQGPNSKTLKYEKDICHNCNTAATQPYDAAYDCFIKWVLENELLVLRRRFIDLAEVYRQQSELHQLDLYKYFAKSFGSRLAEVGVPVPSDIRRLFRKKRFRTFLRITFYVNEDILAMPRQDRSGFIGKGDLLCWNGKHRRFLPNRFTFNEHVSWLTAQYWYNMLPEGSFGSTWVADGQFLYLGSYEPLTEEQRKEFQEKALVERDEGATEQTVVADAASRCG
jgi:hypothetical protein